MTWCHELGLPVAFAITEQFSSPSPTIVVQYAWGRWACDTGDRTQILVDGLQITIGHVVINRPRHDLKKSSVEWLRDAAGVDRASRTGWMKMVHVHTGSDDLFELGQCGASHRTA